MRPVHLDLSLRDSAAAPSFFQTVLGWRFPPFAGMPGSRRIEAGAEGEPGIDSGPGEPAPAT